MEPNFKKMELPNEQKEVLERILMLDFEDDMHNLKKDKEIIFQIIPELKKTDGFDQKHPHHAYDVWEHTVKALQKSNADLEVRMALLLHDIGKPYSYQESDGIRHFKGHPQKSAEMAQEILTKLGYSEKEIKDICYLIEHHDEIIDSNKVNETNNKLIKKLLHMQYCDAYAHAPEHVEKRIQKLDTIKSQLEEKWNNKEDNNKGER